MELFDEVLKERLDKVAPLAVRMRPQTLDEFVGQKHIVGEDTALRKAIYEDTLRSAIFWGPPGSGKTTLARIIAKVSKAYFVELKAVTSNVREVRQVIDEARNRLAYEERKTILFIDELHRFNKAQQDAFLSAVEDGIITLIGTTTENPYFEINSPLISRSQIFQFEPLTSSDIKTIVTRALSDKERGLGKLKVSLDKKALEHIVAVSKGDGRIALNTLEASVFNAPIDKDGTRKVTLEVVESVVQKKAYLYDKESLHYDVISAFIKSMRGSDPDATLYWLARMIYGGEDPKFIARRMIIFASEDIGLADPRALEIAVAAARAVEFVGLPEARLNLAHAALYLALAPKDNRVIEGIDAALRDVENEFNYPVPKYLRDSHYPGAKKLGYGKGYKYPHNYKGHWVEQDYLPPELKGKTYFKRENKNKGN